MWKSFVVIGDSVAQGIGDSIDSNPCIGWADLLYDRLREENPSLYYENLAQRGLLTSQIIESQLSNAIQRRPDLVAITAGANDILKGIWNKNEFSSQYEQMLQSFITIHSNILTFTIPDFPLLATLPKQKAEQLRNQIQELNEIIRNLSNKNKIHYLETWHRDFTSIESSWSRDGVHPNTYGYRDLAEEAYQLVSKYL